MKKLIILVAIALSSNAYAFDDFFYGQTLEEATSKAMKRCKQVSYFPDRCHVIQVHQGDYGPYDKWKLQVADWK